MRHSRRKELRPTDVESALKSYWVGQTGLEDDIQDDIPIPTFAEVKSAVEWINLGDSLRITKDWDHDIHISECYIKQTQSLKDMERR